MRGSLPLGKIAGIRIFVNWSFLLILIFVAWVWALPVLRAHGFTADAFSKAVIPFFFGLMFIIGLFACVLLHELGHAMAARRYGVNTRDITLLLFGGIARLERIPEKPGQEVAIALAGPAVNLVIAGVLFGLLQLFPTPSQMPTVAGVPIPLTFAGFVSLLMTANIVLLVFNLLPAFPMDGGRVLRALLAYRMEYATATRIAAGVGMAMAALFFVAGIMFNFWLILIAFLVYMGAQAEGQLAQVRGGLSGIPVRDAMITNFISLAAEDSLGKASEALLAGTQQDFPVVTNGGNILGILARDDLMTALAERGLETRIGDIARRECPLAEEGDMVFRVFQRMQETRSPIAPVVRDGRIVGLVTMDNVQELLMIRSALRQRPPVRARPAVAP